MSLSVRLLLLTALELGLGIFCLANKKLPDSYRFIGKLLHRHDAIVSALALAAVALFANKLSWIEMHRTERLYAVWCIFCFLCCISDLCGVL